VFLVFGGFTSWFYPPWLYYDVSLYKVVELVVVIPTRPRSLKTESGCSSYYHFCFGISAVLGGASFSRTGKWLPLYFRPDFCPAFCSKISSLVGFSWP
jgi:hypothetical protein